MLRKQKEVLQHMSDNFKINEIFYSIQGEGYNFGIPAIFIRFSGCNLNCSFCDTKHDNFYEMKISDILRELKKYPSRFVVITGGEPYIQLTSKFISEIQKFGYYVCVETNGTIEKSFAPDWITCSPKRDSDWKIKVNPNEIKIIWDNKTTDKEMKQFHQLFNIKKYIQPEGNKKENIIKSIDFIKQYPQEWRLSLQCQKILNIQ